MNKIEQFEKYRNRVIAAGAVDISSSNTPEDISPIVGFSQISSASGVSGNYGETMPAELRALMAACVFRKMDGLKDIDGHQVVIAPQTSTLLVKEALKVMAINSDGNGVIFYPEGNFRYNFHVETFTNTPIVYVPIDKTIFKISADDLMASFDSQIAAGKHPLAFVLETPNNPWMQIYNKKDKTKASYWSCNIGRYWKQLGGSKNFYGYW